MSSSKCCGINFQNVLTLLTEILFSGPRKPSLEGQFMTAKKYMPSPPCARVGLSPKSCCVDSRLSQVGSSYAKSLETFSLGEKPVGIRVPTAHPWGGSSLSQPTSVTSAIHGHRVWQPYRVPMAEAGWGRHSRVRR